MATEGACATWQIISKVGIERKNHIIGDLTGLHKIKSSDIGRDKSIPCNHGLSSPAVPFPYPCLGMSLPTT